MIRTTWPVLRSARKYMRLAVISILAGLTFSTLQADEQLTVVQQAPELPPFILSLENPKEIKAGTTASVLIKATDRTTPEKAYSKKLTLTLLITNGQNRSSKAVTVLRGEGIVSLSLSELGYNQLTVRLPKDIDNNLKILASSSIRVVP